MDKTITLNNGRPMPLLGFGTYQIPSGKTTYDAVLFALKAGYRHIDTAKYYGNEASVGQAIRDSGLAREQIFVTTKLWPSDIWRAEAAFLESFEKLGLDYIDLYLVHWPVPGAVKSSWKKMEKIIDSQAEKVKAIGVSNYSIKNLQSVLSIAKINPAANQIKCSPFNYDPILHKFCMDNQIVMEAYSPLTRGTKLANPVITEIANSHKKSPAQVLLRWCVQKDIPAIPKSTHPDRITENANIFDFELTDQEITRLDKLAN